MSLEGRGLATISPELQLKNSSLLFKIFKGKFRYYSDII